MKRRTNPSRVPRPSILAISMTEELRSQIKRAATSNELSESAYARLVLAQSSSGQALTPPNLSPGVLVEKSGPEEA